MIPPDTLGKVMENVVKRMHALNDSNGGHLGDVISSTKTLRPHLSIDISPILLALLVFVW